MKRTEVVDAFDASLYGTKVNVKGWVRTRRGNKNVNFIAVNDGSTIKNIQVVVDLSKFSEAEMKPITTGACISVIGTLVESQGKGQQAEIQADSIELYGGADPDVYPLQKKGHTLNFYGKSHICVLARIHLEQCCVSVTIWLMPFTNISTIGDFSI